MLLKRLEMQGFKSFADKTVLDFSDGATAVVGPNGSGKSNISDAIRWVIGETRAKSLRGSNMHDVIFAGTAERRPLNYAEVSLVLDNSERVFNIEFDEVQVTRRLFRSGESVYQINKANCRLKDVQELFMDTGLGRDGYSIIGQGNVSQILSTKAEDRRSLFEEAAGVSKYKYRKDEAQRKLAGVEENLVRIRDIASELEGQINPLKRQSEKARRYMELYGEYKTLDVTISLINIDKNEENVKKITEQHDAVQGELDALREKESDTEQRIAELYNKNKLCDEEQRKVNESLVVNEAEVLRNENSVKLANNNIENSYAMIKRIDAEIDAVNAKNAERRSQIKEHTNSVAATQAEADGILKLFDELKATDEEKDTERDELQKKSEELREQSVLKQNEAAALREKISGIEALRESYLSRREAVETEIENFSKDMSDTRAEIEKSKSEAAQKREKHNKLAVAAEKKQKREAELSEEIQAADRDIAGMRVEYNSKASKKRILEEMENDYAGYAKSVKAVLKSAELKKLSIYGTLSGLIEVEPKYVTAIETALGSALQNIVVETEDDAREAIEYLRRTKSGRATFLPISSVKARELSNIGAISKCEGFVAAAPELAKCSKKYAAIVKNLLGKTVVADNIKNAVAMSRQFGYSFRIVTLEGDISNPGGSLTGGSVNRQSGFLSRAAEIKSLHSELARLTDKIREAEENKKRLAAEQDSVKAQLDSYMPLVRECEDEILKLENTIEHLEQSLENSSAIAERKKELEEIEQALKESSESIATLLNDVRTAERESEKIKGESAELENALSEYNREKDERSRELMEKTLKLAELQNNIRASEKSIEDLKGEIDASADEISGKQADKEKISEEIEELKKQIENDKSMDAGIKEKSEKLREQLAKIDEEKAENTRLLTSIQSSNKDLTDRLLQLQQELSRTEARIEKADGDRERLLNRLWDEYELTYATASELKTELENKRESEKQLLKLKAELKTLGNVNMDAIEEYVAVKERFEFLTKQKTDLEKSKDDLNKLIASMESLMQDNFTAQFEKINKSFGEVFRELFGGGSAKLTLSNPDDVLETGVEIDVQLPGKGLQNINLYSGGEKSFIAIALLFAILKVKPTPFCILDEIDAALDDVNVSRFATYLKNYINNTQFIVITHRRGSMEAANILYGVTMQEKGVSKLLSLHIDDVDESIA